MPGIKINDYYYELPQEKIALFPLEKRDESRLLVYQHGNIVHRRFYDLLEFLPGSSFLFFNDTKVIPARILFKKETGADIEIFLLSPIKPSTELALTMTSKNECVWKCTIGNSKRWKAGTKLNKETKHGILQASLLDRNEGTVHFSWDGNISFAEVINEIGLTPLPPYLKRKPEETDRERYQTIYSHYEGAVAAPTAGLHFTPKIFEGLKSKNISHDFLTLHVSAGTFLPVKSENADDHVMHDEQIIVTKKNIENILNHDFIIAVGTTSMRTLESLYWYGAKLIQNPDSDFIIDQIDPYQLTGVMPGAQESLNAVIKKMKSKNSDVLVGKTSIFIKPGYQFRICKGLITNFHQPGSTLILLVAAFVGKDWKRIYDEALSNNYRFLSYGDSSLLIPRSNLEAHGN